MTPKRPDATPVAAAPGVAAVLPLQGRASGLDGLAPWPQDWRMDPPSFAVPPGADVLNEAHTYLRSPPGLVWCDSPKPDVLAWFYSHIADRQPRCPPEWVLRTGGAHVLSGQHVLLPEGWLPASVIDWPGAEAALPACQARAREGAATLDAGGRTVVVVAKAGAQNYGHTLVEILPKLVNLQRSGLQDVLLLLPEGMAAFASVIEALLARLGVRAGLAWEPWDRLTPVADLAYFGPVSRHNLRKSATLLAFRGELMALLGLVPDPRRRLYVDRPATGTRSLVNADEVRAAMEARGFEAVSPGGMPFREQVALFSGASAVAGPLGAGLTNMLFAPAACRTLMFDPGLFDFFYWDLAALAGQPFTWLFAGPLSHYSQELATRAYSVDLRELNMALDRAGF